METVTLSTNIHVLDKADPAEVFRKCQEILAKFDEQKQPASAQVFSDKQDEAWDGKKYVVKPGTRGRSRTKAIVTAKQSQRHGEYCESPCDRRHHDKACWLRVNLDTAYGYKSAGLGCGDLHSLIVLDLGRWLKARRIGFSWTNEFTGDTHQGFHGLKELGAGGNKAHDFWRVCAAAFGIEPV